MVSDDEQLPTPANINRLRRIADQVEAELDTYRKNCIRLQVENEVLRQALSNLESFFFWRPFTRGRANALALIRAAIEQVKL